MIPFLAAPTHEWSTMLTVLKQVQNISTVVTKDSRKTVITFDLQLYQKAPKLQLHAYTVPALDHHVFRLGELPTEMTALRALGTSIEDSAFDYRIYSNKRRPRLSFAFGKAPPSKKRRGPRGVYLSNSFNLKPPKNEVKNRTGNVFLSKKSCYRRGE